MYFLSAPGWLVTQLWVPHPLYPAGHSRELSYPFCLYTLLYLLNAWDPGERINQILLLFLSTVSFSLAIETVHVGCPALRLSVYATVSLPTQYN